MTANGDDAAIAAEDMERAINAPGPGFLGILQAAPSNIRQYAYQDREQFLNIVNHESSNVDGLFLLTGVKNDIFHSTFYIPEDEGPFSTWLAYDAELQLLLFRMNESPIHSTASPSFQDMLHDTLGEMGMARQLQPVGAALWQTLTGGKRPDHAWRPRASWLRNCHGWPNLVLEVALSETQQKLQSDIRWWLQRSQGQVNNVTVLGFVITHNAPRITIDKWTNDPNGNARLQQRIIIAKRRGAGEITITGGPLVIGFESLFERAPTATEPDVSIDEEKLEFWARGIGGEEEEEEEEP
ncbi:hypothetical protein BJX68DRAFT_263952 [Aspergillus pseudodeflectus]|uniref:Uncharacterized protein n=1 Tax=Aspergillus pseudodeflectus TaxID=176178 RepID=A0ABR4KTH8_9EURO